MDPITTNVFTFLDLCGVEAEGHRQVILLKVKEALSKSAEAAKYAKLPSVHFLGGPIADKIHGVCLAEIENLNPEDVKIQFETLNGTLNLPAYFKGLLEKDFSMMFKDPEKAERMKELTLKNQFRYVSKEAANLYLATRFGTQHLNSIDNISKEVVLETLSKLYANNYMNESIFSIVKETIEKLDPSKLSDIHYFVELVGALKAQAEVKPDISKFVKSSFEHAKRYDLFDRIKRWLLHYVPNFIIRALNLMPARDIKELIVLLEPIGSGTFGFDFPFAIPSKLGFLFELEPIKTRITSLDLSDFNELGEAEISFLESFKYLRELKLKHDVKLADNFKDLNKGKLKILYTEKEQKSEKEEEAPPKAKTPPQEEKVKEPDTSVGGEKGGEDASARDDAQAAAPQSNSAPPPADA